MSYMHTTAAVAPPLNVRATQSNASAPVEVSWSPPPGGADIITGYRIYYGNGENTSAPSVVTYIGLIVDGDAIGQTVSVHSEANPDQPLAPSKLITVTVTGKKERGEARPIPIVHPRSFQQSGPWSKTPPKPRPLAMPLGRTLNTIVVV